MSFVSILHPSSMDGCMHLPIHPSSIYPSSIHQSFLHPSKPWMITCPGYAFLWSPSLSEPMALDFFSLQMFLSLSPPHRWVRRANEAQCRRNKGPALPLGGRGSAASWYPERRSLLGTCSGPVSQVSLHLKAREPFSTHFQLWNFWMSNLWMNECTLGCGPGLVIHYSHR